VFAEGPQDNGAADAEADHRSESGDQQVARAQAKDVGEDSRQRENQSCDIEPQGGADGTIQILPQAQLQQERSQSDGRQHYNGQRAGKCRAPGVYNHEHQGEKQQAGGNKAPAARFDLRSRVGSGVGQGVVPSYTGHEEGFQMVIDPGVPWDITAAALRAALGRPRCAMGVGQVKLTPLAGLIAVVADPAANVIFDRESVRAGI
jgi:hypothetical protein